MKVTPKQYAKLLFEIGTLEQSDEAKKSQIAKVADFLINNRDQKKISKIEFEFEKMLVLKGEKLLVEVESAHELDQQQIEEIKQRIAKDKDVSANVVEIEKKIDPKLLGGLKVSIGNETIDSSLNAKLEMLKQALLK